ncbi:hypothetical protein EXIGLDRAFT_719351 [Exidia glandulosa HHB12029]|uniref:Uncharacterized protein n=1 Tax=Exidia glandulosa HHB12029 TaxID=1314781 RepID=A0A165H335_EXIGL|nr:hypothetical protein EXIGLDRAFT_719351 [Exidia glandulosa HHB12029]
MPASFSGVSPRRWVLDILAMVPALTHLAFDLIDLQPDPEGWEPYVLYPIVQPDGLREALETALSLERIQRVVLDVAGERLQDWPIIIDVMRRLEDPRLSVWRDERPMQTWADEERLSVEDAWAGRDVWTIATGV